MQKLLIILLILILSVLSFGQDKSNKVKSKETEDAKLPPFKLSITSAVLACPSDVNDIRLLEIGISQPIKEKPAPAKSDITKNKTEPDYSSVFETIIDPKNHYILDVVNKNKYDLKSLENASSSTDLPIKYGINQSTIRFRSELTQEILNKINEDIGIRLMSVVKFINGKGEEKQQLIITEVAISKDCKKLSKNIASVEPLETPTPEPTLDLVDLFKKRGKALEKKGTGEFQLSLSAEDVAGEDNGFFNWSLVANPIKIDRIGFGGTYQFNPIYIEWNYTNKPKAEIDSLNIGAKLTHLKVRNDDGSRLYNSNEAGSNNFFDLLGISTELYPRIETETKFGVLSVVGDWKSGLPINLIQTENTLLRFEPYIGYEVGYYFRRQINPSRKERWINRPKTGASLFFVPFRVSEKPVSFEVDYVRRMFLTSEAFLYKDNDDVLRADVSDRAPKNYVKAKISFAYKAFFTPFVEFEYGRKPPKYIETDSLLKAGFNMNFNVNFTRK